MFAFDSKPRARIAPPVPARPAPVLRDESADTACPDRASAEPAGTTALSDVVEAAGNGTSIRFPGAQAAQRSAARQIVEQLTRQLDIAQPVRIHIDERAEFELAGRSSRGAARESQVFIRPQGFDATSRAGRRLLAHELAHVAQAGLRITSAGTGAGTGPGTGTDTAATAIAETEARAIGDAFAAGRVVRPPRVALPLAATLHDDETQAREDELLKVPKVFRLSISYNGIEATPQPADQKWLGNVDLRLQSMAALIKALVGKNYSVALLREAVAWLVANGGIRYDGTHEGTATQDETAVRVVIAAPLALNMVKYFTNVRKPAVPLTLTEKQLGMLRTLATSQAVYQRLVEAGFIRYPWYTLYVFQQVMFANQPLLDEFVAAGDDEARFTDAQVHRDEKLTPFEDVLDAMRADAALVDEDGYRALWMMPAKPEGATTTPSPPPADRNQPVNQTLAGELLKDMQSHHGVQEIVRAEHDPVFRKAVFRDWARRMKLRKVDLEGDISLRNTPDQAVQAPDPSALLSHPPLEPPYYDRQAGSEMLFWMNVYTPNMWEHFRSWFYSWEVIRVPQDDWSQRDDVGKDQKATGEDIGGFGSILGSRLHRNLSNAKVDVGRSISNVESMLGPIGMARAGLQVGSSALSAVGSVIKTAFGKFSERPWEYTAPISEPGVYVVRCTATRPEDKTTLIHKMPSVAYLPVWVREAEEITTDRVKVDDTMAQISRKRLTEIQARLADKADPPSDEERKQLEREAHDLGGVLFGDAEAQLNVELSKLEAVKNDTAQWKDLGTKGQQDVDKRIDEIKAIKKKRNDWMSDLSDESLETPEKLSSYFVAQEGTTANRPMHLLLEIVPLKADRGMFRYAVFDNTSKDGEHRKGPARDNKSDAIADAIQSLLEDVGYGRGIVTVAIPKSMWDVGRTESEIRTVAIARSAKMLFLEGLENAALVASIAVIAAAPFTGGASLALLIPIGVIGAIPSAYRIANRVSEGTFEWDMTTAMDVMNCLGAVAGLGQFATSVKLISVSARVWTIVGLGMDGLQGILGTYDLIDKLRSIDPTLPEGARMAEAMVIVGNALLQLGIAVGGHMAAEGVSRRETAAAGVGDAANPNISRAPPDLVRPLLDAGFKDIPVLVDKSVSGPEVKVVFSKDGYGMPTDIHVVAGAGATAELVRLHVETVQLLQKYSGLGGYLRTLIDRIQALVYSKNYVKPGSRGWNSAAEVIKIAKIIDHYSTEIADGKVSRIDGEAYLDYLKQELRRHEQAVNEIEEGEGFIAAQAPKSAEAVSAHDYPPAPPGHYYVEESAGTFQLRAHVGFDGQAKMVLPRKGAKGFDIVDRPPDGVTAQPGSPAAKIDPAQQAKLDPAQLQLDAAKVLGVSSTELKIVTGDSKTVRIVPPADTGTGYVLHLPAGVSGETVAQALGHHLDRLKQRPADLSKIPVDGAGKPTWDGAREADFRGRPTEDGYHWRLQNGKLQYVAEATEEGVKPRDKKIWDDKLGALVIDTGAREVKAWPKDPPTTRAIAFDDLGGNNPTSPFGRWVALMESLGFKRAELLAAMQEPSGLNYDTVRHNLKTQKPYQDAIKAWLTDPAAVRQRYPSEFEGVPANDKAAQDAAVRRAQHRAVLDVDKYLALKDATVWTEKWYLELFGKVGDAPGETVTKVESQVYFDKDKLNAAGIDVAGTRQGDAVIVSETANPKNPAAVPIEKHVLKDVKSHEGALGPDDKGQFADYRKMIGKDVPRADGTTTHIDSLTEVFLDPRGGKANAEWMAVELGTAGAAIGFEVFNTKGARKTFTARDFQKAGNPKALAAVIEAYCGS